MGQSHQQQIPITFNPVVEVFCWLLGSSIKESLDNFTSLEREKEDDTLLIKAASLGKRDVVFLLLQAGADIEATNEVI